MQAGLITNSLQQMINSVFGRVINLTSEIKDERELAPYGASRWAVEKLTDDIASKLKGAGFLGKATFLNPEVL